ncbi:MAG: sulfurtransferase [Cellvibrionaceae bacterium]
MSLPLLLEPADLQAQLDKQTLLIVDMCSADNYLQGHIPGAVHLPPKSILKGEAPAPGKIADSQQLESVFEQLGLTPETHVVVYDDEGGGWAGRLIWTLDAIGHKQYSYLNGGIHAWRAEGLSESVDTPTRAAVAQKISINPAVVIEVDDVMELLKDDNTVVWDARSPEEYRGEKILAKRGGHMPKAINAEWTSLMDPSNSLRIREDALSHLNNLGFNNSQSIITHCQTHHRSGFTYLLGKILGFDIKGYHGSWSEWGNRADTPIET